MWSRKKSIEFFFPAFGPHAPDAPSKLQEQNIYPLSMFAGDGLDLDYSSLLLVDRIIIDRQAYDFVWNTSNRSFRYMRESLFILEQNGFLHIKDYGELARPMFDIIRSQSNSLLRDPELWLRIARKHWKIYKPEQYQHFKHLGPGANREIELLHYGIYCHLMKSSDKIDLAEARHLNGILESRRIKFSEAEWSMIIEIVRPMLSHVILNQLLSDALNCPFLDWDDLDIYYANCVASEQSNTQAIGRTHLEMCRAAFTIALPSLRLRSAKELVNFLKKRGAVQSLRAAIRDAAASGISVDKKWGEKVKDEAFKAHLAHEHQSKKYRFISSIAFGALGHFGSLIHHGPEILEGIRGAFEIGSEGVSPRPIKKYQWMYTLMHNQQGK
jgi:hypothetical protein